MTAQDALIAVLPNVRAAARQWAGHHDDAQEFVQMNAVKFLESWGDSAATEPASSRGLSEGHRPEYRDYQIPEAELLPTTSGAVSGWRNARLGKESRPETAPRAKAHS